LPACPPARPPLLPAHPLLPAEDRICGTIDIEKALTEGVKAYEPGLLAKANRGILYVDEVNLLDDGLVDVVLDSGGCQGEERSMVGLIGLVRMCRQGWGALAAVGALLCTAADNCMLLSTACCSRTRCSHFPTFAIASPLQLLLGRTL
jgi:hypothetical protein